MNAEPPSYGSTDEKVGIEDDEDMRAFSDRFGSEYSPGFMDRMTAMGATFDKLVRMDQTQLYAFAKIDASLSADIILLARDLQTFKNEKQGGKVSAPPDLTHSNLDNFKPNQAGLPVFDVVSSNLNDAPFYPQSMIQNDSYVYF